MCWKFLIASVLLLGAISSKAQDEKLRVAILDPTSSSAAVDEGTKDAVRELIGSTFSGTGKYNILGRSLLQQVMKEQKMSNTDALDESQAGEFGKLVGADKVVLSAISLVNDRNMLSIKLIDVNTDMVDQEKTRVVGTSDLLDAVEPLTLELLGEKSASYSQPQPPVGNVSNGDAANVLSKYTQGKEITFTCESFVPFAGRNVRGDVSVFFDDDLIWSGGIDGFTVKLKDPNPGNHLFKVVVEAYNTSKEKKVPIIGGSGGTFNIDTSSKDFYEFTTNIWNYKVKLKK